MSRDNLGGSATHPIKVLDQKERSTRRKVVQMYKIQWNHHTEEEANWETESYLNQHYPGFLPYTSGISISVSIINRQIRTKRRINERTNQLLMATKCKSNSIQIVVSLCEGK